MRSRGFTLVELLVTIAIVAILVAIAFPSFEGSIRSNRIATATNELLASVSLARSEAVRNTRGSGICASDDGTTCSGTWNDGWIVWQDVEGGTSGQFNAGVDTVVRHVGAHGGLALTAANSDGGTLSEIGFDARGRPDAAIDPPVVWTFEPTGSCPAGQEFVRLVSVNIVGQVKNEAGECE